MSAIDKFAKWPLHTQAIAVAATGLAAWVGYSWVMEKLGQKRRDPAFGAPWWAPEIPGIPNIPNYPGTDRPITDGPVGDPRDFFKPPTCPWLPGQRPWYAFFAPPCLEQDDPAAGWDTPRTPEEAARAADYARTYQEQGGGAFNHSAGDSAPVPPGQGDGS